MSAPESADHLADHLGDGVDRSGADAVEPARPLSRLSWRRLEIQSKLLLMLL